MEKMNGIAVAEKLREKDRDILIVFVTTSPDFMMQAFSVHAFHYITKPYKAEQIYKVLMMPHHMYRIIQNTLKLCVTAETR